ncbi:MAG: hypothetical protein PHE55_20235 [Methylococcaceae bacterium]|nr:hypothetical protein [Methylococcaceae bacterium]
MSFLITAAFLAILFLLPGCSTDTIKRMAYGSVQSYGQEKCQQNIPSGWSKDCQRKESYDEYQRKRQEVNQPN